MDLKEMRLRREEREAEEKALVETSEDIKQHIDMFKQIRKNRMEKQKLIKKTLDFLDSYPKEKFTIDDFCKKTGVPRKEICFFVKNHDIPQKNIDQLILPEGFM